MPGSKAQATFISRHSQYIVEIKSEGVETVQGIISAQKVLAAAILQVKNNQWLLEVHVPRIAMILHCQSGGS